MNTSLFQGSRLREAREARGLTASALAELVDVTQGAISQYENGHAAPAPERVKSIAQQLRVDPGLFFKPARPEHERVVFWRSRKAATQSQRSRSLRKHDWTLDVIGFLTRFVEFPAVSFPQFDPPEDIAGLQMEDIEDVAAMTREQWSLGDGPINNLVESIENHGAVVTRTAMDAEHLDAFSEWVDRPYIVLGSDKDSEARSLFDAAHELGHMILHRDVKSRDFNKPALHALMEKQADRFASALLLPADAFAHDLYAISLDTFRDLKTRWRVAIAAMIYRAREIDIIDDQQAKNLWIGMARRKWRKREPGDDDARPEQPVLVRQAFDMLLDNGMLNPRTLEFELGIPIGDIETVAGLPAGYLNNDRKAPLKFRLVE